MPTPKKGARLGGSPSHQKLIMSNLATSLFEHGRITTTEAKARVLRPVAERLITKAKKGDLHNRRQVLGTIKDKGVVHTLFEEIATSEAIADRPGGYTRITKLGPRKGDNAPMAVIELVTDAYTAPAPAASGAAPSREAAAPSEAAATATGTDVEEPSDAVPDSESDSTSDTGPAAEASTANEQVTSDEPAADQPADDAGTPGSA